MGIVIVLSFILILAAIYSWTRHNDQKTSKIVLKIMFPFFLVLVFMYDIPLAFIEENQWLLSNSYFADVYIVYLWYLELTWWEKIIYGIIGLIVYSILKKVCTELFNYYSEISYRAVDVIRYAVKFVTFAFFVPVLIPIIVGAGIAAVTYSTDRENLSQKYHHVDPHYIESYVRNGTTVNGSWRGGTDGYIRLNPDGITSNNLNKD